MNLLGKPAAVGHLAGARDYEVTRELVDFYGEALGDRSELYEEFAPPLLFHSECYQYVGEWYLKNLFGNLHGQQDWELFAPIRVGAKLRTRSMIIERYHKRGRDYVVNETDVCDAADGRLLVRGRTHQSFLPAAEPGDTAATADEQGGDFVVDEQTSQRKQPRPPFPTATGPELEPVTREIDARRCWMFSGPGRNYHTDAEQARKFGFPTIVVQGMMTTCFVSQVMQGRFGMGWLAGGKASLKLTNVVWVDDTLTAFGRERERVTEGGRTRVHCDVWVEKQDETRVLIGTASALE